MAPFSAFSTTNWALEVYGIHVHSLRRIRGGSSPMDFKLRRYLHAAEVVIHELSVQLSDDILNSVKDMPLLGNSGQNIDVFVQGPIFFQLLNVFANRLVGCL